MSSRTNHLNCQPFMTFVHLLSEPSMVAIVAVEGLRANETRLLNERFRFEQSMFTRLTGPHNNNNNNNSNGNNGCGGKKMHRMQSKGKRDFRNDGEREKINGIIVQLSSVCIDGLNETGVNAATTIGKISKQTRGTNRTIPNWHTKQRVRQI